MTCVMLLQSVKGCPTLLYCLLYIPSLAAKIYYDTVTKMSRIPWRISLSFCQCTKTLSGQIKKKQTKIKGHRPNNIKSTLCFLSFVFSKLRLKNILFCTFLFSKHGHCWTIAIYTHLTKYFYLLSSILYFIKLLH